MTLNCLSAALKTVRLPKVRVKDAFVDHEMDDQLVNTLTTGTGDFTADLEVSHSEFEALDCSKLPQFLSIFKVHISAPLPAIDLSFLNIYSSRP